ncbi:MAG: hypothetical protein Q9164_005761 [Protoblastenia rupestris]
MVIELCWYLTEAVAIVVYAIDFELPCSRLNVDYILSGPIRETMCPKVVERYPGCGCPYYTDSAQRDYACGRSYGDAMTKYLRVGDAYSRSYGNPTTLDLRLDNACPAHRFSSDYQTRMLRRRKGYSIDNWSSHGGGGFFIPLLQKRVYFTFSTPDGAALDCFGTTSGLADTSKQLPDLPTEDKCPNHPQRDINDCPRECDWVSGGGVEHGSVSASEIQEQQAQQLQIQGGKFTFDATNSTNESDQSQEPLHHVFPQATAPPADSD